MDWLGYSFLALSLVWLGQLSRRLGRVTKAPPYYIGLHIGAALLAVCAVVRFVNVLLGTDVEANSAAWILVYSGLPALALTIALVFAWRYWSWLLAERD